MAKINNTKMTSNIAQYENQDAAAGAAAKAKPGLADLFKNRKNLINLGCMVSCFVGNSFCFYLLGIQMKYIRGKFYTNNLVGALSEIAAFTCSGILIKYVGIKPTLVIAYIIALAGMLALLLTDTMN